jgi:hypothetical protein
MPRVSVKGVNRRVYALIGVGVILLALAIGLIGWRPTTRAEYLAWRESLSECIDRLENAERTIKEADNAARGGYQYDSLKAAALQDIDAAERAFNSLERLRVHDVEAAYAHGKVERVRHVCFSFHRKAVESLGLPPMGDSAYPVPTGASLTLVYLGHAGGMCDTLWYVRKTLDSFFGVSEK